MAQPVDMNDRSTNTLRAGGTMMLASAVAQLGAYVVLPGLTLIIFAAMFAVLSLALMRGMTWVAWPSFFVVCAGSVPIAGHLGAGTWPTALFAVILLLNVLAALALFAQIWRR